MRAGRIILGEFSADSPEDLSCFFSVRAHSLMRSARKRKAEKGTKAFDAVQKKKSARIEAVAKGRAPQELCLHVVSWSYG